MFLTTSKRLTEVTILPFRDSGHIPCNILNSEFRRNKLIQIINHVFYIFTQNLLMRSSFFFLQNKGFCFTKNPDFHLNVQQIESCYKSEMRIHPEQRNVQDLYIMDHTFGRTLTRFNMMIGAPNLAIRLLK